MATRRRLCRTTSGEKSATRHCASTPPAASSSAATNSARNAATVANVVRSGVLTSLSPTRPDASPIENTTAPLTGCESTEITL
jgi:hypothetical protein